MEPSPRKEPVIYVVEPYGGSARKHLPSLPLVYWDDAAVTRGDGVFETMLIRDGKAANVERHAQRFADSAAALQLPKPQLSKWREATELAIGDYARAAAEGWEAKCTWTYTRGRASTGHPSAWVSIDAIPQRVLEQREHGVSVMVTPRLWQAAAQLPAKTLNYAATMASLRLARESGYDDVIFTDPDTATVLEGATSTVVSVKGNKLRTPAQEGILPGTTQAALFAYAEKHGYRCKAKPMSVDDLRGADSVWLVSSVRVAARVKRLGEKKLKAPDNVEEIRGLIEAALSA